MIQNRISMALAGASIPALVLAALLPRAATAQSFQGTGTVTTGNATINTGTGTTQVQVSSNQTVIDWVAPDSGGGPVNFQPAGTTASFTTGSGFSGTDYTVLNRIVTQDTLGAPTNSAVQFNGTVQSDLLGGTGGNVWFYSPNGIIVGASAQFSVGGLVLTTDPIDTTGGLYGPNGEIRFTAPSNGASLVSIAGGAQITASLNPQAPNNGSYIAIVSPRIEQGGTVRADGPIAYVAANAADITMNAGMFDIAVSSGTDDPNGIVHTGSTGGSSSAGAADPRVIRMVAVSKNDGLTMLLSGSIGYDAAASATDDSNAVILTAGHGIDGVDAAAVTADPSNITVGDAHFTSAMTANVTGSIHVTPTIQTVFDNSVQLNAIDTIQLDALGGASIIDNNPTTSSAFSAYAGYAERGGTIAINVGTGSTFSIGGALQLSARGDFDNALSTSGDAVGGTISLTNSGGSLSALYGDFNVSAVGGLNAIDGGSATAGTITIASDGPMNMQSLALTASAFGADSDYPGSAGGLARGGTIQLSLTGNGSLTSGYLQVYATGEGGRGAVAGGDAYGGSVTISTGANTAWNASNFYNGDVRIDATARGGDGGDGIGGNGYGGRAELVSSGGVLDFGYVSLGADGHGGDSSAQSGNGFGGTAGISLTGGTYDWDGITLNANAAAGGVDSGSGIGGNATGSLTGGANLALNGATVTLTGELYVTADASGATNGQPGAFASAGHAGVALSGGSSLTMEGSATVSALATMNLEGLGSVPLNSPSLTGGEAVLSIDGSNFDSSDVSVLANVSGVGALQDAGTMTGGTARLSVANGGTLQVRANSSYGYAGVLSVDASASGNFQGYIDGVYGTVDTGAGASAIGGTAQIGLAGGTIAVDSTGTVNASGNGGPAGNAASGSGTGGTASLTITGGTMSLNGALTVMAEGTSGDNGGGFGTGNAAGGLASIDVTGGALNVYANMLTVSANALAGDTAPDTTATAGNAIGGTARLQASGGGVFAEGQALVSANGSGGLSNDATGGSGTGGSAMIANSGSGTMGLVGPVTVLAIGTGGNGNGATGLGGDARGGSALVDQSGAGGTLVISGDLTVGAGATAGYSGADSAALGTATGGTAALLSRAGDARIGGNVSLDASALPGGSALLPPPPTVAGLVQLGSANAASGGYLTIGGNLTARAEGDAARSDGLGFSGAAAGAPITVFGQTAITATGNIDLAMTGAVGSLNSTGSIVVSSTQGAVTGTGALSSIGAVSISAPGGIALSQITSNGDILLQSALGAVSITDMLLNGVVTVSGRSVDISSAGALTFADADATGGALSLTASGELVVNTVDATGAVTLTSGLQVVSNGAVNGSSVTYSAGTDITTAAPVTASGDLTMTALGGISAGALSGGGNVSLIAGDGGVVLGDVVQAGGLLAVSSGADITTLAAVSGNSITFSAGGDIANSAPVTAFGDITMQAVGNLSAGMLNGGGNVSLTATNGDVTLGDTVQAGRSLVISSGANVTMPAALSAGADMRITAGHDLTADGDLTAGGGIDLAAGNLATLGGAVAGATISVASADIAIGRRAQVGRRGTTQTVRFTNSSGDTTTWLGGTAQTGGYSLDAAEFAQVFADQSIAVAAGQSSQPGDMVVDALSLSFGASGQIGTGGSLLLSSPGRIAVTGPLALQTSSASDSLGIDAGSLEVVTDAGGIALADSAGARQGRLNVNADRFVVASSAAITALDQATGIAAINAAMDTPPATSGTGGVSAGAITATVRDGIYVQNTGASTAYADRRGFNVGALTIATGSRATRIVINGVTYDANGQIVTGLDTVGTIAINGSYAAGSTVNGCAIGGNCGLIVQPAIVAPVLTKGDLQGALDPDDTPTTPLAQITVSPITVDVPEFQPGENLPLVDDPVTGIGNEDLWEAGCSSGAQGCAGDSSK
ncbi:hypothetical protein EDF56_105465 [Novosphingobium sp. PhB165]|uniref:beta strand repeat-containing protein n=1 Tax=Novosphingobium sp. PhB165 TaxID=2485105 RepID=UPI00104FD278|nr:hypothetical protein [Novosphingobium sp. PhB165]TCM18115.1 hypothetical protein EDF56_105465 [Novosphingobium sp. PhB165]